MKRMVLRKNRRSVSNKKLLTLFAQGSAYLQALLPLLTALNWKGSEQDLIEAAPHLTEYLDLAGFINMLDQLGYSATQQTTNLQYFDNRLFPCLFVTQDKVYVLLAEENHKISAFDATSNTACQLEKSNISGKLFLFKKIPEKTLHQNPKAWLRDLIDHYRGLLIQILILTLVQSFLLLAVPIFVMNVYDKVITTGSYGMLTGFLIGVLLSLGLLIILQYVRYQVLAYVGAQLDQRIGNKIVEKLLFLPSLSIENSPVSAQLSQIKNFDMVRDFFSGQPMVNLIDAPFIIIFIIALGIIGKWLILIPIVMFILLIIIAWFLRNFIFYHINQAANESADLQKFLIEMLTNLRLVKLSNATKVWLDRYQKQAADKAFSNYQSTLTFQVINIVADAIMIFAGLAILGFGALSVLNNVISVGALLASMILTWRILGPLKSLLLLFTHVDQLKVSIKQINNLMHLNDESVQTSNHLSLQINTAITYENVYLRFPNKKDSALNGISLQIKAGTIVGITGRSCSGKSLILKVLLNLYPLSSGDIYFDGHNILQYDQNTLRRSIAYVPQQSHFFYGTIKQNLLLRNPLIADNNIEKVLKQVGLWEYIKQLPNGIDTKISDCKKQLSDSFLQRLNIARALIKKAKMLLLDEAIDNLDTQGDADFQQLLKELKGKMTILMVTQRPSHLRLADQMIVLDRGQIVANGDPDDILDKLLQVHKNAKI